MLVKPLLNLFHGEVGGKAWRRSVDASLRSATSVEQLLDQTLGVIPDEVLDAPPSAILIPGEDLLPQRIAVDALPTRGAGFTASDPPLDHSPRWNPVLPTAAHGSQTS
mmetsp:Transcript_22389/g.42693  ORF Transcript_22389/g.42693 Transcript_22389/m.42693 type:complete len:108 (+) Transcript_22389:519-842(+)